MVRLVTLLACLLLLCPGAMAAPTRLFDGALGLELPPDAVEWGRTTQPNGEQISYKTDKWAMHLTRIKTVETLDQKSTALGTLLKKSAKEMVDHKRLTINGRPFEFFHVKGKEPNGAVQHEVIYITVHNGHMFGVQFYLLDSVYKSFEPHLVKTRDSIVIR